jgi:DNA-binding transcriptional LysR family regulator
VTQTDFDPQLLRTFLAVATTLSFTRAATQLGRSQPTVSQQVRRLEDLCGRQLLLRDTRAVTLTDNGEAMAGFARTILAAQDEAVSYFTGSAMRGRLRFGAADELALSELPSILRDFRQLNPRINLELTVTQSGTLLRRWRRTPSIWSSSTRRRTQIGGGSSAATAWCGSGSTGFIWTSVSPCP